MLAEAQVLKVSENNYLVSYGNDKGIFAEFFSDAIIDENETKIQGRPIYRNVDMLRMMFPGDTTKEVIRIVRTEPQGREPADPDRFPRQWAAYKSQIQQVQDGTPIEQWPPINKAQSLELKAMNIHTVEQLAATSDVNLKWMGARQLRDNAIAWLNEAKSGAETIALRNQIDDLKREIEALKNTNAALAANKPQPVAAMPLPLPTAVAVPLPSTGHEIKPMVTHMANKPQGVNHATDATATYPANG